MTEMKRITADEVVEAYRKTGIQPTTREYFFRDQHGVESCCAIGAISIAADRSIVSECVHKTCNNISRFAASNFGRYGWGFTAGFDGRGMAFVDQFIKARDIEPTVVKQGYEDGNAAAIAVGLRTA
jgi:hypothetical protein